MTCQPILRLDTSTGLFNPVSIRIPVFRDDNSLLDNANKFTPKLLVSYYVPLSVGGLSFQILTVPQSDGSFITRAVTESFSANGQGKTEKEALEDIKEALALLIEEADNPSGDVDWPTNFQ